MNELTDQATPETSAEEQYTKIVIGEVSAPLAELSVTDSIEYSDRTPLHLDQSITRMLGDMIRMLPGVVAASVQASTTTYILRFAPDVAAQLGAGTATLMQALNGGTRAVAVNSGGQIVGHGTLVVATGMSSIMTATLLWQTLALVTAQHYLHDMQQQLNAISSAIKDLKAWMLNKELATLISHERYLQSRMHIVERGAVQELDIAAISNQLDHMERECDQVQELMRLSMEHQIAHVRRAPIAGWFGWEVEQNIKAAQEHVNDFNNAAQVFAAAVRVKGMLAAFRQHFFLQTQVSSTRLEEAYQDCKRGQDLVNAMYDIINKRSNEARATVDPLNVLFYTRRTIKQQSAAYRAMLNKEFDRSEAGIKLSYYHGRLLETGQRSMPSMLIERSPDNMLRVYGMPHAELIESQK